jgi:hypothetical protein
LEETKAISIPEKNAEKSIDIIMAIIREVIFIVWCGSASPDEDEEGFAPPERCLEE